jgi:hypothetical protein
MEGTSASIAILSKIIMNFYESQEVFPEKEERLCQLWGLFEIFRFAFWCSKKSHFEALYSEILRLTTRYAMFTFHAKKRGETDIHSIINDACRYIYQIHCLETPIQNTGMYAKNHEIINSILEKTFQKILEHDDILFINPSLIIEYAMKGMVENDTFWANFENTIFSRTEGVRAEERISFPS